MTRTGPASALRMVVTLASAGLLSGSALASVYMATAPRIARHHQAALAKAVLKVVPGAARFEAIPGESNMYATFTADGQAAGLAIQAEGPGFMDTIRLLYGFSPNARTITGLAILDSRETPGLGDKIMTDPGFVHSFDALQVDPEIVPATTGPRAADNEVDCISGATISSKAVVNILQRSLAELPLAKPPKVPR